MDIKRKVMMLMMLMMLRGKDLSAEIKIDYLPYTNLSLARVFDVMLSSDVYSLSLVVLYVYLTSTVL